MAQGAMPDDFISPTQRTIEKVKPGRKSRSKAHFLISNRPMPDVAAHANSHNMKL